VRRWNTCRDVGVTIRVFLQNISALKGLMIGKGRLVCRGDAKQTSDRQGTTRWCVETNFVMWAEQLVLSGTMELLPSLTNCVLRPRFPQVGAFWWTRAYRRELLKSSNRKLFLIPFLVFDPFLTHPQDWTQRSTWIDTVYLVPERIFLNDASPLP
jgi:hypothetical protein